jgi:hypothetical protein
MIGEKAGKGCMDNNLSKFDDLIQLMEKTPRVAPPADFTRKVMTRLSDEKIPAGRFSFWRMLGVPILATNLAGGFRRPVAKTECAFYFILTGFFFLVLGLILISGLQKLTVATPVAGWLTMQPLFSLLAAFGLLALGLAIYLDGIIALRLARVALFIFAVMVIVNGWTGMTVTNDPFAVFIAAIFSLTGLGLAAFLGIAVDHYEPQQIYSQEAR